MLSKYQRISQDLIDKIDKQEIKVHSYLPSENELMKLYNASRDTIRKALDILLKNGYIQKNKGKGSLVLDVDKVAFPVSGVMSFKELAKTINSEVVTKVIELSLNPVDVQMKKELYNYIENELGLKISFARKEFTVVKATEEEKNLLDMHEYDLLVCVKSYTYLEDASLFQYTISKHRPDKFRFVDFARRTQL